MKRIQGFCLLPLLLLAFSCQKEEKVYNQVRRGDFRQTITETGELFTADTKTYVMPRFGRRWYSLSITGLIEHGTKVNKGDSLIQFDPTEIRQYIVNMETRIESQQATLQSILVNNDIERKNQEATLRSETSSFELSRLSMESSRFETEKIRKVKELQFRQSEIRFEKIKRNMEYSKIISANEEKIQRIRLSQMEEQLKMAYDVLPQLTIRSTSEGIFQIARRRRRSPELLKVGDEVRFGNRLGSVPDLTWMKVNTTVNEVDIPKIQKGQKVWVRMDALPDVAFPGEVSFVSLLCREYDGNDPRKVFDIVVTILESDERLKPGMTVSCEFVAADMENVLYVPNTCIHRESGRYWIYTRNGIGEVEKTAVNFVSRNNTHTVIEGSNVHEGMSLIPVEEIKE